MKNTLKVILVLVFTMVEITNIAVAQSNVIDQVVAQVGGGIILHSEVQEQKAQMLAQGGEVIEDLECAILEQLILQQLLIHQAKIDSVEITDGELNGQLENRMRYIISQIGSEEKLEEYYGKTILEIKEELGESLRESLLAQRMQQQIIGGVTVSPLEIKEYFESIPKDSLPLVNSEVMYAHIVKIPLVSKKRKKEVKDKLNIICKRVVDGESMSTLAASYSQDQVSAAKGGEITNVHRGDMVKEFEAMAYTLAIGEVSEVFETQFGYHFIQLTARRGEVLGLRHILLKLNPAIEELAQAEITIDSIAKVIATVDSITFEKAAMLFSDDGDTKHNGGVVINAQTGNTMFEMNAIDRSIYGAISTLKIGEVSKPMLYSTPDGKQVVRIVKLIRKTNPHRANLKEDYQKIKMACEGNKKEKEMNKWVDKKGKGVFIKIIDDFRDCEYNYNWIN
ncbi:MAG: peptidylprolyl isomerase [Flavobacteriales bacterium]|nr:peptidylprolyl isomerase [Flavobacteriales bacterium]